jgi:hypothetical protein
VVDASKGTPEALAWQVLPNGLRVDLALRLDPSGADIAVCSTDETGRPGPLNETVLKAVGISPEALPTLFQPPVTVLTRAMLPVLVVQTVGSGQRTADLLKANLGLGLEKLHESDLGPAMYLSPRNMHLPLLGTGAGGLSHTESAAIMMEVLTAWKEPVVQRVWLSAPSGEAAEAIANSWRKDTQVRGELSFEPEDMEPHVLDALGAAKVLAAGAAVTPSHVLRSIGILGSIESPAFQKLREIAALPSSPGLRDALAGAPTGGRPALTREFDRQLRYGQRPLRPSEKRHKIWGRDLITAALFAGGVDLESEMAVVGRSPDDVIDEWYRYVTEDENDRTREQWDAWWTFARVPLPEQRARDKARAAAEATAAAPPGPPRAGYFADTDVGEDHLGVEQEAEALARLMLDETVAPPLSIGLLGDWGSGKSFFIEQLKQQIDDSKGAPGLCEDVVQIEFNAWHVSDGNLWASLVTHIFEEIWKQAIPPGDGPATDAARAQLAAEIAKAEGALHEAGVETAKAQAAVQAAERRRAQQLLVLSVANVAGEKLALALKEAAKEVGWQRPIENLVDAQAAARSLASAGEKLRMQLGLALGQPLHRFVVPLVVGVAAAAAVWWGLDHSHLADASRALLQRGVGIAGGIGGVLAALLAPMRRAKRILDRFGQALEKAQKAPADEKKKKEVEAARRELETTDASLAAARARLAELRNQEAAMDPAKRLGAFLEERVQSTQYRAQQGIIALVHRDFKQLSERMAAWRLERRARAAGAAPRAKGDGLTKNAEADGKKTIADRIRPIDRIVLYIDDLDRCRPEHVVATLEAVHLLLALDLFVVVVAVDSRWLIRALEVQYKEMLAPQDAGVGGAARRSTAYDYLEKIFQLTYALAPMDPGKFGQYVDALTGAGDARAGAIGAPAAKVAPLGAAPGDKPAPRPAAPGSANVPSSGPANGSPGGVAAPPSDTSNAGSANSDDAAFTWTFDPAPNQAPGRLVPRKGGAAPRRRPPRPQPTPLRFDAHEKEILKSLVSLLPTPRMAKRLVNVYRLIKASRPAAVATEARQKAALFLLAVLYGRPLLGAELLRCLYERTPPFDRADVALTAAIARHAAAQPKPLGTAAAGPQPPGGGQGGQQDEWEVFRHQVEALGLGLTVGDCSGAPEILARYSFVTGHEWHTWAAARPAEPAAPGATKAADHLDVGNGDGARQTA